mgnify:CR=1 FL=1
MGGGLVEVIRETGGDWAKNSVSEESESATDEESSEEEGQYLSQDDPSVPVPGAREPRQPLSRSHSLTVEQPPEAGSVRERAAEESESVSGERESLTERARRMFPRRSRSASPAVTPIPRISAESLEERRGRHLRKYHMDTQEFYSQNEEMYHRPCVKCGHPEHSVIRCPQFTPLERYEQAGDLRLCKVCLIPDHTTGECYSRYRCYFCGEKHNKLICLHYSCFERSRELSHRVGDLRECLRGRGSRSRPRQRSRGSFRRHVMFVGENYDLQNYLPVKIRVGPA